MTEPTTRAERAFAWRLGLITAVALAIRVAAAFWYDAHTAIGGDAVWYTGVAHHIVAGHGFVEPLNYTLGHVQPTAAHPPLYPLYLAVFDAVHEGASQWLRVWSGLPGTATVLVLGLVGRDVAGERTGLLAAALATVSIALFTQDVLLWSEGLFGFTIALTLLAAYRYLRRPDVLHGALLAGAVALAALTRAEGALLFLILFVPLVVRQWGTPARQRWLQVGVAALVCLVLFAPWLVYNNTGDRFEKPVGLSVGLGTLIGSSNCRITYHGGGIGAWGGLCEQGLPKPLPRDESVQEQLFRDAGLKYARHHADRLPIVVPIRVLRSFGFYAPVKMTADDLLLDQGGAHWAAVLAVLQYWLYVALGIAGAVVLVRRKVAILPFVAPVVTVVVISVIGYGTMRFRVALDVVLPVVAAAALDAAWRRARGDAATPPAPAPAAGTVAVSS